MWMTLCFRNRVISALSEISALRQILTVAVAVTYSL